MRLKTGVGRALLGALLVCATLTPFPAAADDVSGVVRALVHDRNNRPLQGARVVLSSSQSPPFIRTTDGQGRVVFLAVLPGDYVVTASKEGYYSRCTAFLYIFPGQIKLVTFPLEDHIFNIGECYYFDRDPVQF